MRTVLETHSVTLGYGSRVILRDVDLRIVEGEQRFLLGANGVGKTTLIRALLGALRPLSGRIVRDPELAAPGRLGFVPQRCELSPGLSTTVGELVTLGLVGIRCRRGEREDRLLRALARVGVSHLRHEDLRSLSGGQRQRALVARALIREPGLLLLDEPTAGLDLASAEGLLQTLDALNRKDRLTILLVTHHLDLALRHGERFALCVGGRIRTGSVSELLTRESLAEAYGIAASVEPRATGGYALQVRRSSPADDSASSRGTSPRQNVSLGDETR